jgi:hypothetical protein
MRARRFWPDGVVDVNTSKGWEVMGRAEQRTMNYSSSRPRHQILWNRVLWVVLLGVVIAWLMLRHYGKNSGHLGSTVHWKDFTPA